MDDQAARLRALVQNYMPGDETSLTDSDAHTIAITSGKGGVGKTNFTVNLAIALLQEGIRTLVIDADLGMANVDVVLGSKSTSNLIDLLQPDVQLANVITQGPYGVQYISGGSAIDRVMELTEDERRALIQKLAACSDFADYILIDTSAGLGQNVLNFILAVDEVLLLTTTEPTALADAYSVIKAYSGRAAFKNMRLVVNQVEDEIESREVTVKLRTMTRRFLSMPLPSLGYIYSDRNVVAAVKRRAPFMVSFPDSLAAQCVRAIARSLLYGERQKRIENQQKKSGWRGFLSRVFSLGR